MGDFIAILIFCGIMVIALIMTFIISIKVDKDKKKATFLAFLVELIAIIVTYMSMPIPSPEIYPSNGQISEDGSVKIRAEKGLGIYYTLSADSDPRDDGIKYKNKLKLDKSATINVKTHFLGRWSECVTLDLVFGKDGSIKGHKTQNPGTSVESITASCVEDSLYEGVHLTSEDIKVEGKTISGNIVPVEDFIFTPNSVLKEGENIFTISYENLETNLEVRAKKTQTQLISNESGDDNTQINQSGSGNEINITNNLKDDLQIQNEEKLKLNGEIYGPSQVEVDGEEIRYGYDGSGEILYGCQLINENNIQIVIKNIFVEVLDYKNFNEFNFKNPAGCGNPTEEFIFLSCNISPRKEKYKVLLLGTDKNNTEDLSEEEYVTVDSLKNKQFKLKMLPDTPGLYEIKVDIEYTSYKGEIHTIESDNMKFIYDPEL